MSIEEKLAPQLFVEDGVFEIFVVGKTTPSIRLQSRREIREWATRRLHERNGRFTSRTTNPAFYSMSCHPIQPGHERWCS
jgi:hypothetical protein